MGGLRTLRFVAPGLLFAALAIQLSLPLAAPHARFPLVLLSLVLAGRWLLLNLGDKQGGQRLALVLLAAGWALNVIAIAPNGGMPVSRPGLAAVGARPDIDVADGHLSKHVVDHPATRARWLGDTIPVRPLRAVVSVGDVLLVGGIGLLIASAMTDDRSRSKPDVRAGAG